MWLGVDELLRTLLTLCNLTDVQCVNALGGDRGSTTFYPAPNNRPSTYIYTHPKF